MFVRLVILGLLALVGGGCAKYEFDLTQPRDLAKHVGSDGFTTVLVDPLEYRLRAVENRLVMEVYNPTQDSIELIGPKSVVVDPGGQSHPLRSQSIAPAPFIKLIFPPMRPRVYQPYYGPEMNTGFGVGYQVDGRTRDRAMPVPTGPHYITYYDDGDAYYWDWKGDGEARIQLTYQRDGKQFRHAFSFVRKKL